MMDGAPRRPSLPGREIPETDGRPGVVAADEPSSPAGRELDLAEWLAVLGPMTGETVVAPASVAVAAPQPTPELSSLMERWVKRVALGGDQRRGVARIDIAEGRFAGAELLVVAEAGQVSVELSLPADTSAAGMVERLRSRLERRGLSAEVVVR